MYKKAKNFSCALLMLILLINFSSVFHTFFHISMAPEVFCAAQHNADTAPHLEDSTSPVNSDSPCPICEYQLRCDCTDIVYDDFVLTRAEDTAVSLNSEYYQTLNQIFFSSRAPPCA